MNAKISKLGRQATIWCCDNLNPDTPREDWDAAWEQKFAELIVRECMGIISDESDKVSDEWRCKDGKHIWWKIKEHFGVEE